MRMISLAVLMVVLASCTDGSTDAGSVAGTRAGSTSTAGSTVAAAAPGGCADVIGVEVESDGDGTYRFDVTVASADTGWDKYADAWEVRRSDGTVLGVRELTHPHENEQPFTRSLAGVIVPNEVTDVVVAARDSVEGFCGDVMNVSLG